MSEIPEDRTYKGDLIGGLFETVEHAENKVIADEHAKEHQPEVLDDESDIEQIRRQK